jgi:succinoglycan biosynthesis transport protein ExoP
MLKMTGLTPQNPVYIASQAELDSINAQMKGIYAEAADKATGQLLHRYTSERLRAAQLEYQLRDDLSKTQTLAANVTPKLQQAEQLNTEIARLQENSAMVDNRITTLSLENNAPGSEHVVSLASPPTAQVGRHLVLYILLLPILGLITAIAVTFVLDVIDPKVYTGAQIRTLLGFYPIGMLLRKPDFPASLADEYITRLAVGIDQAHRKTGARTFLFTSAGKGSTHDLVRRLGAELVANGLATLVVVVEAAQPGDSQVTTPIRSDSGTDLVRPGQRLKIFRTLGADVEAAEGGCEVVTKSPQTVAEFVRRTRTSYETMLIGADPLLISAHSEHLARVTDGTVVVAESGEVTKKQLTRAARLLERLKIPGIAIVLSQIAKRRADQEILENASEYAQRQGV